MIWGMVYYCFNHIMYVYIYMVGGFNPSEKYEFVSWDNYS